MKYDFKAVEAKWQEIWDEEEAFSASNDYSKPKFYALVEFPYPSGQGLHVGHPRSYTALDIIARKKRLEGYNVLYPMGWDAFGLPTENFAIKHKIHPAIVTKNNVARFKSQLRSLGISFDWSREINTTDSDYYKWTQWIFLKLYEKGLAYKKEVAVNWCVSCKCVLANEEVVDGCCERCSSEVVRKVKSQWMLKITEYADRLISDLDDVDYLEKVKLSQINWIGKSQGAMIHFDTSIGERLTVYSTRPDTIFGATYMVISPEHAIIDKYSENIKNISEILEYRDTASKKSDFERTQLVKNKTGVKIDGITAKNPANDKGIPIFVSDYVIVGYGTGAVMGVPAHDQRDYDFAKAFSVPIVEVITGGDIEKEAYTDCDAGVLVNSEFLNGLSVEQAKKKIVDWLSENGLGEPKTNFKLRDWVFSRQRYWGEPIPMIHCDCCGWVPLKESDLPLELPNVESYEPTDTGESPLSSITDWVNVECPKCGGPAKRETDTMPQWAGSSWYFMRYCDTNNSTALASKEALDYWLPVDWYNGGMEHTTLHLLYSRFWYKFLYDIGLVSTSEPYAKRTSHGMILGENGEKMSKSRRNFVNPDEIIDEYGADTLRIYEMFIGDFEKSAPWKTSSIKGSKRFLERVAGLTDILVDGDEYSKELEPTMHRLIKKVSEDIEQMKFNTAIAAMMATLNTIYENGKINHAELLTFITLLNPFAPHITEELYEQMGENGFLFQRKWQSYNPDKCVDDSVEIAVQISGKIKSRIMVASDATQDEAIQLAKNDPAIATELSGKTIVKEIYVKGRLVNIVVK